MLEFAKVDFNDKSTYKLLGMGLTKGIFQLEEHLGERYAQIVKPRNIRDIADIISIIRPGCKEAKHVDGETSMLDAYCKIRNGEMQEAYLDDGLKPILGPTHSVLIYQEQIIEICQHMAGMSLKDGDMVRKAMGKKLPEEMREWKDVFVNGCVTSGHTEELALKMWDWIDKASGYLFNKSHAIAYAVIAFKTAYAKCHFPIQFFAAMLKFADKKTDTFEEMLDLVNDAKLYGISVIPSSIAEANSDFKILDNKTISYGIRYLKGVGESSTQSISRVKGCTTWGSFLVSADRYKVDKTSCEALIKAGVLDDFGLPRTLMLAEYELYRVLTRNEQAIVLSLINGVLHPQILIDIDKADFTQKRTVTKYLKLHTTGIFDICGQYGAVLGLPLPRNEPMEQPCDLESAIRVVINFNIPNSRRREKLLDLVNDYNDKKPFGINKGLHQAWEKFYYGIPLTSNDKGLVVEADTLPLIEVLNVLPNANIKVAGIIEKVSHTKIKKGDSKGRTMAFIDLADNSYILKGLIAFSDCYDAYSEHLIKGTAISILGRKMRDGNSIIVNYVKRL